MSRNVEKKENYFAAFFSAMQLQILYDKYITAAGKDSTVAEISARANGISTTARVEFSAILGIAAASSTPISNTNGVDCCILQSQTFSPIPTGNLNTVIKKTKMTTTNVVTTSFPISPFVVPAYVNIHA
ncbi:hypothetical protein H5410_017585 [Solanum commersonii]|uniref:Uncharacterized protein n=1 Tax=Solanum commersonii TaxID=4109 RepID=A0A9J5ZZQ5_SOLCO|nr:hypothetical protein H5410_017585 [Solanum commersonii]